MGGARSWVMLYTVVLLGTVVSWPLPHHEDTRLSSLELAIIKCIVEAVPGATEGGGIDWSVTRSRSRELQAAGVEIVHVPMREPDYSVTSGHAQDGSPDDWTLVRLSSDAAGGGGGTEKGDPDNWNIVKSISTELHLNPEQEKVGGSRTAYEEVSGAQQGGRGSAEWSGSVAGNVIPPAPAVSGAYAPGGGTTSWSIDRSVSHEIEPTYNDEGTRGNQPSFQSSGGHAVGGGFDSQPIRNEQNYQQAYQTGGFSGQPLGIEQSYPGSHQTSGEHTKTGVSVSVVPSISEELGPGSYEEVQTISKNQEHSHNQGQVGDGGGFIDFNHILPLNVRLNTAENEVENLPASPLGDITPPGVQPVGGGVDYWNTEQQAPPSLLPTVGDTVVGGGGGGGSDEHNASHSSTSAHSPAREVLPPIEETEVITIDNIHEHQAQSLSTTANTEETQPCEAGEKRIKDVCRKVFTFQLKSKLR